jgi:hypothetical protein
MSIETTSVAGTRGPVGAPGRGVARQATHRVRLRVDPYPLRPWLRWLVRLLFAVPYLLLSVIVDHTDFGSSPTVNHDLVAHVRAIPWNTIDVGSLSSLYPPFGTLIARVIPDGIFGLSVAGSLVAGVFLQLLMQGMHQRRYSGWTIGVLLVALAANPLFAYTATCNFEGFLSLVFFGLGVMDMVRFITRGSTQAGFRAGILFMLCALSSASGLVLVAAAGLAAPLLVLARRGERGARWSNVLVILFPTLAMFGSVVLLQLVFLQAPFALFRTLVRYEPAQWSTVSGLFTTIDGLLLLAPLLSGWALAVIVRRPGAIPIALLLFVALIFGRVAGLIPPNAAGNVFIVFTTFGIAILPAVKTRVAGILITLVGVVQFGVAWCAAFNRPVVIAWMGALAHTMGWR